MYRIEEFVDERNKSWCIHCGQWLMQGDTNEDHVPSKSLLRKPHPHHLPTVRICKKCNSEFSKDEQYLVTFLSCVLAGSSDPEAQRNASAARSLAKSPRLRQRITRSRSTYETIGNETKILWKPEVARVERVVLKNARGHAYFEFGEPKLEAPSHIWVRPMEFLTASERREFDGMGESGRLTAWPEVGSRMMTRVITGQDMSGPWVIIQEDIYRYAVSQSHGLLIRSVLSEYLATEVYWEQ